MPTHGSVNGCDSEAAFWDSQINLCLLNNFSCLISKTTSYVLLQQEGRRFTTSSRSVSGVKQKASAGHRIISAYEYSIKRGQVNGRVLMRRNRSKWKAVSAHADGTRAWSICVYIYCPTLRPKWIERSIAWYESE